MINRIDLKKCSKYILSEDTFEFKHKIKWKLKNEKKIRVNKRDPVAMLLSDKIYLSQNVLQERQNGVIY